MPAALVAVPFIVQLGVAIVSQVALSYVSKLLAPKPGRRGAPPLNVTVRGSIEPRRLVFGTRKCGGAIVFYTTSGSNNETLWYVVAYAGHQVEDIRDVYLDSERIADADIDGSGNVTAGRFSGKASCYRFLGTSAQTVETNLDSASVDWTTNHRLRGNAYAVFKLTRDDTAFPGGSPQAFPALIDGAKLYDPRLDSTNGGSGSHRASDPSTWTFSHNPALAIRWYLTGGSVINDLTTRQIMYGLRESDSRIDDAYIMAAANICDQSITGANAPPAGGGGGTQPRYRLGIEVSCAQARREILTDMLASMAGQIAYVHGKWRVYAGAYDSPVHSFTQDDLYGDIEVQDTTPHDERYNATAAVYVSALEEYTEKTTIYRTDSAYETQDGGEQIQTEIELRGVTNVYQAQRLAEIHNRKSRLMRTVKFVGALNFLKVAPNETFNFSHLRYGWTNRVFRCIEREVDYTQDAGRVVLTCRAESTAVWTDMLTADYTTGTSSTDVFTAESPEQPTALTATSTTPLAIDFTWTVGTFWQLNGIIELWEHTSITPFASAVKIWEGRANGVRIRKTDTTTRYYWIRIRTIAGAVSANYPTTNGVAGAAVFVRTGDINPNAATDLLITAAANITGVSHDTTNYYDLNVVDDGLGSLITSAGGTTLLTGSIAANCTAIVTGTWKASSSLGSVVVYAYCEDLTVPSVSLGQANNFFAVPTTLVPGAIQDQFSLVAGHSYRIGVRKKSGSTGNSEVWVEPIAAQVELIKR